MRSALIEALAHTTHVQDFTRISIENTFDEPTIPEQSVTVNTATTTFLSCDRANPHGAILRITDLKSTNKSTNDADQSEVIATLADFHKGIEFFTAVVIPGLAVIIAPVVRELIRKPRQGTGRTKTTIDVLNGTITSEDEWSVGPGTASLSSSTK